MSYLLVDIGNSYAKILTYPEKKLLSLQTNDELANKLKQYLLMQKDITKIVIASSAKNKITQNFISICNAHAPIRVLDTQATYKNVVNGYTEPSTLGVDRWLCLIAAREINKSPTMIVNMGTAITYDYLDQDGKHLGGWIIPNEVLIYDSFINIDGVNMKSTDDIFSQHKTNNLTYGHSTTEAVALGTRLMLLDFFAGEYKRFKKATETNGWPISECLLTGNSELAKTITIRYPAAKFIHHLVHAGIACTMGIDPKEFI